MMNEIDSRDMYQKSPIDPRLVEEIMIDVFEKDSRDCPSSIAPHENPHFDSSFWRMVCAGARLYSDRSEISSLLKDMDIPDHEGVLSQVVELTEKSILRRHIGSVIADYTKFFCSATLLFLFFVQLFAAAGMKLFDQELLFWFLVFVCVFAVRRIAVIVGRSMENYLVVLMACYFGCLGKTVKR